MPCLAAKTRRKRIVRYVLLGLLAVCVAGSGARLPRALAPDLPGRLEETGGLRTLYLRGSPYEMGLQQGCLLREPLRALVVDYLHGRWILERGVSHLDLLSIARRLDRQMPGAWQREAQGIADGAGLSYADVLLLNAALDLPSLLPGATRPPWSGAPSSSFAAWGRSTSGGELLVGHSLACDDAELLRRCWMIVVRRPSSGRATASLGLMGTLGAWAGMSEDRLVACLSPSPCVDVAVGGQPASFLLRQVLEGAGDLSEATNLVLSSACLSGGNWILGDGKAPDALVIELSAHRHALYEADATGGVLARTDHWLDPDLALIQQGVLSDAEREASAARLTRLQTLLQFNSGWIGTQKALAFLEDVQAVSGAGAASTPRFVHSVLFCPSRLTVWLANVDAQTGRSPYVSLDLSTALLAGR